MVNHKRVVFCALITAVAGWCFYCQTRNFRPYAFPAVVFYTVTGITGLAYEITNNLNVANWDNYAFELSHIIGIDLLAVEACGVVSYGTKIVRYELAIPIFDLIARFCWDDTWEPITEVTHVVPIALFFVFAYTEKNVYVFLAGVNFLFAHFFNKGDFDDVLGFSAAGLFFTQLFFEGKDLKA